MELALLLLGLLAIHFIGDFVLQTHWQASNKSTNWKALSLHVASYTACLFLLTPFLVAAAGYKPTGDPLTKYAIFAAVNGAIHWGTDYVTSRITKILWDAKEVHNFFVVIGLDQLLHQAALFLTLFWILFPTS